MGSITCEGRGRRRQLSLITALALLYLVWFSFVFHLISVRLN